MRSFWEGTLDNALFSASLLFLLSSCLAAALSALPHLGSGFVSSPLLCFLVSASTSACLQCLLNMHSLFSWLQLSSVQLSSAPLQFCCSSASVSLLPNFLFPLLPASLYCFSLTCVATVSLTLPHTLSFNLHPHPHLHLVLFLSVTTLSVFFLLCCTSL